ncbi:hypothetical protein GGS26DRAFT_518422 [Hypomontagnella submonticulosa]|nr:hypothetical protein GGS26DRAFT_518422 [Hypomontagnella submonticulosa]
MYRARFVAYIYSHPYLVVPKRRQSPQLLPGNATNDPYRYLQLDRRFGSLTGLLLHTLERFRYLQRNIGEILINPHLPTRNRGSSDTRRAAIPAAGCIGSSTSEINDGRLKSPDEPAHFIFQTPTMQRHNLAPLRVPVSVSLRARGSNRVLYNIAMYRPIPLTPLCRSILAVPIFSFHRSLLGIEKPPIGSFLIKILRNHYNRVARIIVDR